MNSIVQYDFFLTKEECMLQKIDSMERSLVKMRKALFAKTSAVVKKQHEHESRLATLEENICTGKVQFVTSSH
jgi:hypothetical protein